MVIAAGFIEGDQVTESLLSPELAGTFEPALLLTTSRFSRAGANRPALAGNALVIHPGGVVGKIVLLPGQHFTRCSAFLFQPSQLGQHFLFLSVPELMQPRFHPRHQLASFLSHDRRPHSASSRLQMQPFPQLHRLTHYADPHLVLNESPPALGLRGLLL